MSATPAKVLLVDDEPSILRVITRILRLAGHEVFACESFEDAKAYLDEGLRPELLITDVVLGNSTGKRVATAVQEMSPKTRLMFMSGFENVAVGGHPILRKPFSIHELTDLVEQVLSADSAESVREHINTSKKKRH